MAYRRTGDVCSHWHGGCSGVGVGIVDLAQFAIRGRYWISAGASRRGRLHAVDVALVRFNGRVVCGTATARGVSCDHSPDWADDRLVAALEKTTPGSHGERGPDHDSFLCGCAHRICAI